MRKNWQYITLGILLLLLLSQYFWNSEEPEQPNKEQLNTSAKRTSPTKVEAVKPLIKPIKKQTKEPQLPIVPITRGPADNRDFDNGGSELAIIEQFQQSRAIDYNKIAGFPAIAAILGQECGNLIDTEIERAVVDVNSLSGGDIFVSEPFCMASAIWGHIRSTTDAVSVRSKAQLDALQSLYDDLLRQTADKTERVIVTKLFLQHMSKHYVVFPTKGKINHDRLQLAVLIKLTIRNGKIYYVRPLAFNLINQLEIPEYLFKDILENTLFERRAEIIESYRDKVEAIFEQQRKLFEQ